MVNSALAIAARRARTFLGRLRRNTAGNVLALTAAALPPILILVGGAVDMSRAYMAQTSLQNACDAGVLAGRRAQAKSGSWGTTEQAKAQRMFDINFQASSANATGTTFTATNPTTGVISATATTNVPATIMKMFGTTQFPLTATCSAEFQVSNIDVMLVLDTTGSMACRPDGSNCYSDSTSKIEGLKSAIRSFYYTLAAAVPSGSTTRVRFAFVPYNGTVNLTNFVSGGSPVVTQSYLSSSTNYQTRLYHFDQPNYTSSTSSAVTYETYGGTATPTQITQADCTNYGINKYPTSGQTTTTTGTQPGNVVTTTYAYYSWINNCGNCQGNSGNGNGNLPKGTCVRSKTVDTTTYTLASYGLSPTTPYRYTQASLDTANLKALTATNIATEVASTATVPAAGYTTGYYDPITLGSLSGATGITATSTTWNGCIEERSTVNSLFTNNTVPSGALDHDLVSAPTATATTQWKPWIPRLVWNRWQSATLDTTTDYDSEQDRQTSGGYSLCAPAAKNFATVDTSVPNTVPSWIETYLATLVANGNTYHDIGMIWGARLAATNGINATTVNAGNVSSVSRHIIFLTDGDTAPNIDLYNSYGLESLDNRVAPSGNSNPQLATYHNARYTTACQTAKNMGYTIWVIGFGQSLTTPMTTCASGGRSYYASDTTTLQTTFRTIASQVADLRLRS